MRFAITLVALLSLLAVSGCKKKPKPGQEAVARATAEYGCDTVQVLSSQGHYYRLDVCGKVRHYRCVTKSCSDTVEDCGNSVRCVEVKRKTR